MRKTDKTTHPDLPEGMRIIEDDEWENFPKHEKPPKPDKDKDKNEHVKQVQHEKLHGHPAFQVDVPPDGEHRD